MYPHVCHSDVGEATLKITGVTTEDDGIYTCIAVNDMGSASSSASLRVLGKLPRDRHLSWLSPEVRCVCHTWWVMKLRTKGHMCGCPKEAQISGSVTHVNLASSGEYYKRVCIKDLRSCHWAFESLVTDLSWNAVLWCP